MKKALLALTKILCERAGQSCDDYRRARSEVAP